MIKEVGQVLLVLVLKIAYNCFNCGFSQAGVPSKKIGKKYKDLAVKLGATNESVKKLVLELMKIEDFENEVSRYCNKI